MGPFPYLLQPPGLLLATMSASNDALLPFGTVSSSNFLPYVGFRLYFYHIKRKVTNAGSGKRKCTVTLRNLAVLDFGGMWTTLLFWTRKAVEFCKQIKEPTSDKLRRSWC